VSYGAKVSFLLALALALGFIAYTLLGPGGGAKRAQLEAELQRIQGENKKLQEENRRLSLQAKALQERNDFIEKTIREELGLIRPDELILSMPPAGQGDCKSNTEKVSGARQAGAARADAGFPAKRGDAGPRGGHLDK
jgi:cell division protein FtsB